MSIIQDLSLELKWCSICGKYELVAHDSWKTLQLKNGFYYLGNNIPLSLPFKPEPENSKITEKVKKEQEEEKENKLHVVCSNAAQRNYELFQQFFQNLQTKKQQEQKVTTENETTNENLIDTINLNEEEEEEEEEEETKNQQIKNEKQKNQQNEKEKEKEKQKQKKEIGQCGICYNFATEPVLTVCGHLFCWFCLKNHFDRENSKCPTCGNDLQEDKDIIPVYGNSTAPNVTTKNNSQHKNNHDQNDTEEITEKKSVPQRPKARRNRPSRRHRKRQEQNNPQNQQFMRPNFQISTGIFGMQMGVFPGLNFSVSTNQRIRNRANEVDLDSGEETIDQENQQPQNKFANTLLLFLGIILFFILSVL
ncbi:hypothetical protein M0812_12147 [Anaeramoeba flamelloides]|uniref:RING-type E3 ubiquitin transferase n=1 Tax=Anaeramoeba flamelloides TaxID=1746091 RepID=A0AAV7ZPI3_9EUKA|nr:hypothetical protein M0812_12147 [Anaeramoeba flamelloides]